MIRMKLVKKTKVYITHPSIGLVKQGDEVDVYKKYQKDFEDLGFEVVEDKEEKDKGVKK